MIDADVLFGRIKKRRFDGSDMVSSAYLVPDAQSKFAKSNTTTSVLALLQLGQALRMRRPSIYLPSDQYPAGDPPLRTSHVAVINSVSKSTAMAWTVPV